MAIFWYLKEQAKNNLLFFADLNAALAKITEFHQKINGCPATREESIFEHFYNEESDKKIEAWVMFAKASKTSIKEIRKSLNMLLDEVQIHQINTRRKKDIPAHLRISAHLSNEANVKAEIKISPL